MKTLPKLPADPIVGPLPLTPEWYALRRYDPVRNPPVVLGASLAGALCGLSPFTMALEVFLDQRGRLPAKEITIAMEDGIDFEPVVLKKFAKRRNVQLVSATHGIRVPMYLSRQWPWMAATPDDFALFDPIEAVDAKVTTYLRYDEFGLNQHAYGQEETDQLPTDNVMQAQQQMAVMGLGAVQFPVMFDIRTIRLYRVQREQALIDMIVAAGEEMVERIKNDDPPEPNYQHPKAVKIIREMHGLTVGKTIELDDQAIEAWTQLSHVKLKIKDLEEERETLKAIVQDRLGDAERGLFPRGTKQIKRTVIRDSVWTDDDLREISAKIGQVKRKGHERLLEAKVKGE
jgi:predicted phage-related endonuclease